MAALAYAHSEPPSVRITVDDDARRIRVRISGPASGPQVAGPVSRLYVERRELCAFDMLYDLSAYNGDVTAEDIDPIVEAYAACGPDPAHACRTAFVTSDRLFQLWASAMDEQFPGREHRAFPFLAPALAWLAVPLSRREREGPGRRPGW